MSLANLRRHQEIEAIKNMGKGGGEDRGVNFVATARPRKKSHVLFAVKFVVNATDLHQHLPFDVVKELRRCDTLLRLKKKSLIDDLKHTWFCLSTRLFPLQLRHPVIALGRSPLLEFNQITAKLVLKCCFWHEEFESYQLACGQFHPLVR